MSDFLISLGRPVDMASAAARLRWNARAVAWTGGDNQAAWLVSRVDAPGLWGPARGRDGAADGFITGRLALEEAEWAEAERLAPEGGLACRLMLDRWRERGAAGVQALNASGVMVVVDRAARRLHLWTDRLGFSPAFMHESSGAIRLGSHPDVIAAALRDEGAEPEVDRTTLAEMLRTGTATHPHTYWSGIQQLDAGTYFAFDLGAPPRLAASTTYWTPAYFEAPYIASRGEAVERLEHAIRGAVRRRTLPRLGPVGVMLSAGADSRAAVFGACDPTAVTCHTLCDVENDEVRAARRLAEIAGATHITHERDTDYYIEGAPWTVAVTGAMWSAESGHYTGIIDALEAENYGSLITGCYADYMMKGITYCRKPRLLFGRELPLHDLAPFAYVFHHPHFELAEPWAASTKARLDARFSPFAALDLAAQSRVEHLRLSPIVREVDAASRLFLRRTEAYDPYMADAEIVDLFGRVHPRDKLNGVAFGMAVQRLAGPVAAKVRNNNYYARVGASELERAAMFAWASVKRKANARLGAPAVAGSTNPVATPGSWPNFGAVMRLSERLHDWWTSRSPEARDLMAEMIGRAAADWSLDDWAERSPTLFIRYFTAALWLDQIKGASPAVERAGDRPVVLHRLGADRR